MDSRAATYTCFITAQRNNRGGAKETIVNIGSMVKELLQNFEKNAAKNLDTLFFSVIEKVTLENYWIKKLKVSLVIEIISLKW